MTEQQLVTALLDFQSVEASPPWRPDPAHLRDLTEQVRSAFSAAYLEQGFAGRLREAILGGLSRLDALPRDDPFWDGTNRRPTLQKVRDLASRVLERGPVEEWACWAWAATDLLWCCNDFGLAGWRGLHELGLLDAACPVLAAFHVWGQSGYDPSPYLAAFLHGAGLCVGARNALEPIEASQDEGVAGWARAVARDCPVAVDPRWLAWDGGQAEKLARAVQREGAWHHLPVLADALEEAGCDDEDILGHLRGSRPHAGRCWIIDLLLAKEPIPSTSGQAGGEDAAGLVRFRPSRAEGLPDVREVVVYPDRLLVCSAESWLTFPFSRMGRRQESRLASFVKRLAGRDPWPLLVADRDWFHPPPDRFFRWYTDPPLRTCMPQDEPADHAASNFWRIQKVLASGGYATFDLG
jgi:hypothetical protein